MPRLSWTTVTPLLAAVALAVAWPLHPDSAPVLGVLSVLLVGAVLAAVHHAEVVAHRVVDTTRALAEQRNVVLEVEAPDHPCLAEADIRRVERVVRNLVTNAIDHAHPDGKRTGTARVVEYRYSTDEGYLGAGGRGDEANPAATHDFVTKGAHSLSVSSVWRATVTMIGPGVTVPIPIDIDVAVLTATVAYPVVEVRSQLVG